MRRVLAVLAVASTAAVLLGPVPVAVPGGLLLSFVLPGLALLGVLRVRFTTVERVALVPAFSMAVLIIAGLVIHLAGLRLDRNAWTVATAGVTLVVLLTSYLRTAALRARLRRAPVPEQAATPAAPLPAAGDSATVMMSVGPPVATAPRPDRRLLARQLLPMVLVAVVLGGACWLSFATSRATHETAVTALSARPIGSSESAGNRTVEVAATGLFEQDAPYTLTVTGAAGTATVKHTIPVTGAGNWKAHLSLPAAQRMTVNLYRSGDTTAFRTLYLSAVD